MAIQDEQPENAPVSLPPDQELPAFNQVPHTPDFAPSEQFVFPEDLSMFQASTDVPRQPLTAIADDTSSLADTPLPDQQLSVEQMPLIEHGLYSGDPAFLLPPQTALPPQQPKRKRLGAPTFIVLCLVIILVLLGSSGLIYDVAYYQPQQAQVVATAIGNAQATSTVSSAATTVAGYATADAVRQQATVQAYQNLYQQATSGTPFLNDSLSQQTSSTWDKYQQSDKSASCGFKNGSYHAYQSTSGYYQPCYENTSGFADFAFQVDMTILSGDKGGLLFRSNSNTGKSYLLDVDISGVYHLYVYTGFKASESHTILFGSTRSMTTGSNQIAIVAKGSILYLYINQQFIDSVTDATLKSGLVGVLADDYQQATEVAFSNAKVWVL